MPPSLLPPASASAAAAATTPAAAAKKIVGPSVETRTARAGGHDARSSLRRPNTRRQRLSEELEAKRLNDLKTAEIRAAQEDPTSMFDMSNAR